MSNIRMLDTTFSWPCHPAEYLSYRVQEAREGQTQCKVCGLCTCGCTVIKGLLLQPLSIWKLGACGTTPPFYIYQWHWHAWTRTTVFSSTPQMTVRLGCSVMEEKLRRGNRIKGSYMLWWTGMASRKRVLWIPDLVDWVSSRGSGHVCSLASQKDKV